MSTMALLEELHSIHMQLGELRGRQDRGPRRIAAQEANVQKLAGAQQEAADKVQQTKMTLDRKQLDLKTSEQKVAEWKVQLNACKTNKEYQALVDQIAAAEMASSVLEDEILEGLERIETLEAEVHEAESLLNVGKADLEKTREKVSADLEVIGGDLARLEERLAAEEAKLPADIKTDYLRVVQRKAAEGLSIVEDQVCTGCGQKITLNNYNEMNMGKPHFCSGCGSLMYLPA